MAIYNPAIRDYAPFYIQRASDVSAIDIRTTYGIIIKDSGYPMQRKVKPPYKNDWKDRSGDDEWNASLQYEAFEYTFECAIFSTAANSSTARQDLKNAVRTFQNAIKDGEFKIWSEWSKFGFQKVRIEEFPDPGSSGFSEFDGHCRLIFKMIVKINDPVTEMKYYNGSIVTA